MISKIRPAIIEKADGYIPLLLSFTIITFFVGLYFSLIESPADYIQGDSMRINLNNERLTSQTKMHSYIVMNNLICGLWMISILLYVGF